MDMATSQELSEFANALIHSRQHVSPRRLLEPGPTPRQLQDILGTAGAAPDHQKLMPWRFVVVPTGQRERLASAFGQALLDRDPHATEAQIASAREKAHRAPFLMLAIVRLAEPHTCAPDSPATPGEAGDTEVGDAERLVSLGCAIQNMVLSAHAAGLGSGLTSGQALASPRLRTLFGLRDNEPAVCCINLGTVTQHRPVRLRPGVSDYVSELG